MGGPTQIAGGRSTKSLRGCPVCGCCLCACVFWFTCIHQCVCCGALYVCMQLPCWCICVCSSIFVCILCVFLFGCMWGGAASSRPSDGCSTFTVLCRGGQRNCCNQPNLCMHPRDSHRTPELPRALPPVRWMFDFSCAVSGGHRN